MKTWSTRLGGSLLTLALMLPAAASPWTAVEDGDGYRSASLGTVRASQTPQPPARVLSVAKSFAGVPYVWAGHAPQTGFDCSGYVYEVLRLTGYQVPRMADEQFEQSERVTYGDLQPGDMVFFTTYLEGPSHVGLYVGGGDFIHASSAAEGVVVSTMSSGYYRERFLGGGRPDGWVGASGLAEDSEEMEDEAPAEIALVEPEEEPVQEFLQEQEPPVRLSPFSTDKGPQPVRVSVTPDPENTEEAVLEEWSLALAETVAVTELQVRGWMSAFSNVVGNNG